MKYVLAFFIGLFLLFFTLNYFNNQARKKNKQKVEHLEFENKDLALSVKLLQESKQKIDTFYLDISDSTRKVYEKRIKSATSVVYLDTTNKDVKQLIDSVRTDDLKLNYVADYVGEIYGIDFTWTVKERTIVKENIVKEPYPVEKRIEVPVRKRMLYFGASMNTNLEPSFGAFYIDKKKKAYKFDYNLTQKSYSLGIYFNIF